MLTDHFDLARRIAQMRTTCVGPYLDEFSTALAEDGYARHTIRSYIRAADHLGRSWDEDVLVRFRRHLSRCTCTKGNKGVFSQELPGVRLLLKHLLRRFLRTANAILGGGGHSPEYIPESG